MTKTHIYERTAEELIQEDTESYLNTEFVWEDHKGSVHRRKARELRSFLPPYMVYMTQPWSYVFDIPNIDVLTISGGRNGGGKTENVSLNVLEQCYTETLNVVCLREHSVTLSESIRTTFANWIGHPFAPWSYLILNKRSGEKRVANDFWSVGRGAINGANGSSITFKGISSSTSCLLYTSPSPRD